MQFIKYSFVRLIHRQYSIPYWWGWIFCTIAGWRFISYITIVISALKHFRFSQWKWMYKTWTTFGWWEVIFQPYIRFEFPIISHRKYIAWASKLTYLFPHVSQCENDLRSDYDVYIPCKIVRITFSLVCRKWSSWKVLEPAYRNRSLLHLIIFKREWVSCAASKWNISSLFHHWPECFCSFGIGLNQPADFFFFLVFLQTISNLCTCLNNFECY